MRKWEGFAFGWCAGVITSVDSDGRRTIDKAKVNFFARYDMDPEEEEPVPHVLESSINTRQPTEDAEYNSWLLLEKVELEGEQGGEDGEEEAGGAGDAAFLGSSDCAV